MDVMSTAQLLGNLGEFVGAIAVVVTLIYVAAQVKHGKAALDANTRAMDREYDLRAQEGLLDVGCGLGIDAVAIAERPKIQDAALAQLWLDGLGGKQLSDVDEYRFGAMMHEAIWQSVSMRGRMLSLGRSDLANAQEQMMALHISGTAGYSKYWKLNRKDLSIWGYGDFVQAVDALVEQGTLPAEKAT